MGTLKKLGIDSLVYGLGGGLSKGIVFIMLPIYTRFFSPSDFGNIEIINIITVLLNIILVFGMDSTQSYYFFKYKNLEKKRMLVSSIIQFKLSVGLAILIIATLLSPLFNALFFDGSLSWNYFAIAFSGSFFFQIFSQGLDLMRLLFKPWHYVSFSFFQTITSITIILIFVMFFDMGIRGYFAGHLFSSMIAGVVIWHFLREYIELKISFVKLWPELTKFSTPILLSNFVFYFMSSTDRWFISYYNGNDALGLFSVGVQFSLISTLVFESFRKAWWPVAMEALHSGSNKDIFQSISRLYSAFGVCFTVILSYFSPFIVRVMTTSAFHEAWCFVGVLALQSLFYSFYLMASLGIFKMEKTSINFYIMAGATVIGVSLNWLFVPSYGSIGAASASAITYFIWIIITVIISEKLWYVGFPLKIILFQIIIGLSFLLYYYFLGNTTPLYSLLLLFLTILLILIITLTKKEILFIKSIVANFTK